MSSSSGASVRTITTGVVATSAMITVLLGTAQAGVPGATLNGLRTAQSTVVKQLQQQQQVEFQSMLLKYTARCALRADQSLDGPPDSPGHRPKFPGSLGVAPEWLEGTCDGACQEKVSSCLIALVNRTGKHVQLSLLSGAPAMGKALTPNENDLGFPYQEGAFFGNVFSGEAYTCRGHDVEKAAQVKRFCALEPESCTGLAEFNDAGRCEDVCEMRCVRLSDGSERCAAASCTDPDGRRWSAPITTYLRNQIEAGNADHLAGSRAKEETVEPSAKLGVARYERVDFGTGVKTFTARLAARRAGARIEVWTEHGRRLGVLQVKSTGGVEQAQSAVIDASGLSGIHQVVLKLYDATRIGRLSTIEFR